jgi:hypothetical protein
MKLETENTRKSLTQAKTGIPRSTTVTPVNPDAALLQELCDTRDIPSDDMNISSDDEQRRFNNALLQCQKKYPTLEPNFLTIKLSEQENNGCSVGRVVKNDWTLSNLEDDNSKYVSYDGTFIWKITNLVEKTSE